MDSVRRIDILLNWLGQIMFSDKYGMWLVIGRLIDLQLVMLMPRRLSQLPGSMVSGNYHN